MPGAAPPRTQRCLSYQGTHQARPDVWRALTRAHARAGGPADGYHCIVGAPTA